MIPLTPSTHAVQAARTQQFENGASSQLYVFKRWEGNLTLILRTIDIAEETNQTLTAYYNRLNSLVLSPEVRSPFCGWLHVLGEDTSENLDS
jgi:hypothetical protein